MIIFFEVLSIAVLAFTLCISLCRRLALKASSSTVAPSEEMADYPTEPTLLIIVLALLNAAQHMLLIRNSNKYCQNILAYGSYGRHKQ